jgi:hypothetical protein
VIALINSDAPLKEVILTDTEQTIEITQADDKQTKVKATWVGTESQDIITRLNARVAAGRSTRGRASTRTSASGEAWSARSSRSSSSA